MQYCAVLCSTVQYCTGSFIRYKKKENRKRNTNGEGATSGASPVRVTFLIVLFVLKDLGPCFGMNGHPRRATDAILKLSRSKNRFPISFYRFWKLK